MITLTNKPPTERSILSNLIETARVDFQLSDGRLHAVVTLDLAGGPFAVAVHQPHAAAVEAGSTKRLSDFVKDFNERDSEAARYRELRDRHAGLSGAEAAALQPEVEEARGIARNRLIACIQGEKELAAQEASRRRETLTQALAEAIAVRLPELLTVDALARSATYELVDVPALLKGAGLE